MKTVFLSFLSFKYLSLKTTSPFFQYVRKLVQKSKSKVPFGRAFYTNPCRIPIPGSTGNRSPISNRHFIYQCSRRLEGNARLLNFSHNYKVTEIELRAVDVEVEIEILIEKSYLSSVSVLAN